MASGRARGFSLVELLVAFTILGLVLAALAQVFGDGLRAVDAADLRARAVLLAQSRLARAGVDEPLRDGVERGTEGVFAWRTELERDDTGAPLAGARLATAYKIRVSVRYDDGLRTREIVLQSLRLDPGS